MNSEPERVAAAIKSRTSAVLVSASRKGRDILPVLAELNARLDREQQEVLRG